MNKITGYDVLKLCQRKRWFTNGTTDQYNKVLAYADAGGDIRIIAYMIWICSFGTDVIEIENELKKILLGGIA